MTALIIVLDVVAHSLGLLNLFLLALLWVRDRDTLYVREFLLMACFSLIVAYQSLQAAFGTLLPPWLVLAGGFVAMLGVSGMIFALPWYVNHLEPVQPRRLGDRIFAVLAVLSLAGVTVGLILELSGLPEGGGIREGISNGVMAVCLGAIAYTLVLALLAALEFRKARKSGAPAAVNGTTGMAMRMGLLTCLVMPVLVWLDFAGNSLPGFGAFRILPIEYLLWSLLLMNLRVRTILELPSRPGAMAESTLDDFCRHRDISPREREVLELLVRGQTYECMAASLFISLSTVKTHVGKLYRKAGVSNKVELIHTLQQEENSAPGC